MNNIQYEFNAKCITIQVPLNGMIHHRQTRSIMISLFFSSDNINNTANNGAFWMLNGGPQG